MILLAYDPKTRISLFAKQCVSFYFWLYLISKTLQTPCITDNKQYQVMVILCGYPTQQKSTLCITIFPWFWCQHMTHLPLSTKTMIHDYKSQFLLFSSYHQCIPFWALHSSKEDSLSTHNTIFSQVIVTDVTQRTIAKHRIRLCRRRFQFSRID